MDAVEPAPTPLCGSCNGYGVCRLGAGTIALDGNRATVTAVCAATFHAGPRVAHGGWTSALFDDVMGRSLVQRGHRTVTASLTVDYLRPVPVEEPLVVEICIDSHEGRRVTLSASLRLVAGDAVLARASGIWVERRPDHFEQHEKAMSALRVLGSAASP